jgi:flavin-dependent dehydrogenase
MPAVNLGDHLLLPISCSVFLQFTAPVSRFLPHNKKSGYNARDPGMVKISQCSLALHMTQTVDVAIVGAGPGGLRAAQVLADAGRDVLVVERRPVVGPKTCAGGLSHKAVGELSALGLPEDVGLKHIAEVSMLGEAPTPLDAGRGVVRTISRASLGALQAQWARRAGAVIVTGCEAVRIDVAEHRLIVDHRIVRYRHLIGADGSTSCVRRALGVPTPRAYFAGEFKIPEAHATALRVLFDSPQLASGYFWIFPHCEYVSYGAGAPMGLVRPRTVRRYLETRVRALGWRPESVRFEAAAIEVQFFGFHFRDHVHLVGDAAGVASGLTGEGIYAALITGEEVARQILDPAYPAPKTCAWLRLKRLHDAIGSVWLSAAVRKVSFGTLAAALRAQWSRRWTTRLFLGG